MSQRELNERFPDVTRKVIPTDYGKDDPKETNRLWNAIGLAAYGMLMIFVGMFLHAFIIWLMS